MPNETRRVKAQRSVNATAAGTSAVNGSTVDMQNFESVTFIAALGTLTASQVTSLKAQGSTDNSTWADIPNAATAAAADADSNKLLVLEVFRPMQRYVRAVVNRGTANAVVDAVIAIQSGPRKLSTIQDATTVSQSAFVTGS